MWRIRILLFLGIGLGGMFTLAYRSPFQGETNILAGCASRAHGQPRPGQNVKTTQPVSNKNPSQPRVAQGNFSAVMFRGGAARHGRTTTFLPRNTPKILWKYETQGPLFGSPAVDQTGNIYVGSLDGQLYSLSPQGKLRWRKNLGDRIFASPLLTAASVIIGADNDRVYSISTQSGKANWVFSLGPCNSAPGLGYDAVNCDADSSASITSRGQILFGGDFLYQLSPQGTLLWKYGVGQHAQSSPAIATDGTIFIGSSSGVHAISPQGVTKWTLKTKGPCDSTPALFRQELVIIGCDDQMIYGLSQGDGTIAWQHARKGAIKSSAAVTTEGLILVGSDDQTLVALRKDGTLQWSFRTGGAIRSSPLVDPRGTVVFGSQDNHLYALDGTGKLLWKVELGGDIDSSVAVFSPGILYVGADDGALYALQ